MSDLIINASAAIDQYVAPRCVDGSSIEDLIFEFLRAKAARTKSMKTVQAYRRIVLGFRTFLQETYGWDLLLYTRDEQGWNEYRFIRAKLAAAASDYSVTSKTPGRLLKDTTRNQTLAALSSFYQYADMRNKSPFLNPITMVERSPIEEYDGAEALPLEDVPMLLEAIDQTTLQGKRDYALLQVLFNTGARVGTVLALCLGDVHVAKNGSITLFFRTMKGGKETARVLTPEISLILFHYIEAVYGTAWDKKKPVWIALTNGPTFHYGDPLKYQAVRDLCQKYLGTSKVHTTRHTFSKAMYDAGATLEDVQLQLEHSDPKLTQKHYTKFQKKENTYRDVLTKVFTQGESS